MASNPNRLTALNTNWHNHSHSSITSEATTFHSAHGHLELSHLESPRPRSALASTPSPLSPKISYPPQKAPTSSKPEGTQMARQDSGYSEGVQSPSTSSRRTSTSTTSTHRKSTRHTSISNSTSTSHARPSAKRAARSSPILHYPTNRPGLQSRHTTPYSSTQTTAPYQFFQFPELQDTSQNVEETEVAPPLPPPPPTCQYWTSDSTRRLEYAAIDAASKGLRGFVVRLIPDCILPVKARRTKFHNDGNGDADSDAGSVRRYRIPLAAEEKSCATVAQSEGREGKPGLFKRLTSFGRD